MGYRYGEISSNKCARGPIQVDGGVVDLPPGRRMVAKEWRSLRPSSAVDLVRGR